MARTSKWILASLALSFLGTQAPAASSLPLGLPGFATNDPAIYDLPSRTPFGYQSTMPGAAFHASLLAGADAMTHSPHGIRYDNGKFLFSTTDIESAGQSGFGHTRSWASSGATYEGVNGCEGWAAHQLPTLFQHPVHTSKVTLYMGADPTRSFEYNSSTNAYTPHHFYQESMTFNSGGTEIIYKTTTGERWIFHDWSHGTAALRGRLKAHYDSNGNPTTINRTNNQIDYVQKVSGSITEKWLYTYVSGTGDANRDGQFQDVTLQYGVSGNFTTVRKAVYDYYTSAIHDGNGTSGDVKTVKIQDGSGTTLSTKYYRYNTAVGAFVPLRFVVEGRAYERLKDAAGGTDAAVFSAADTLVDDYAQYQMTYDAFNQVATQVVLGAGCG